MNTNWFLRFKKPLLIGLGVLVLLALLLALDFAWLKKYLRSNVYPDLGNIFYEEAQEKLAETGFPTFAEASLYVFDKFNPGLLLHMSDYSFEERTRAFDYTKQPALFKVESVDSVTGMAALKVILPSMLEGEITDTEIKCSLNKTRAGESVNFTKAELDSAIEKFEKDKDRTELLRLFGTKELRIATPVVEFISASLQQGKTVQLNTTCTTWDCDFTGEECSILVF